MSEPRWVIQREEAWTFCEERHPMRLGRRSEHYSGEPWERDQAIRGGKRGYLCPGGHQHTYPIWVVFDAANDARANAGAFDTYREAKALRDRLSRETVEVAR